MCVWAMYCLSSGYSKKSRASCLTAMFWGGRFDWSLSNRFLPIMTPWLRATWSTNGSWGRMAITYSVSDGVDFADLKSRPWPMSYLLVPRWAKDCHWWLISCSTVLARGRRAEVVCIPVMAACISILTCSCTTVRTPSMNLVTSSHILEGQVDV